MKRICDEKDLLYLLVKYNKKVYRYNFLIIMFEIIKEEIVINRNKLNKVYFLNYKFNSELGEKIWKFLNKKGVKKYYGKINIKNVLWSCFGGFRKTWIKGN